MKYITELDTDRIKKIADKMPDNSALVKMDDRIFGINVSLGIWNTSQYGASLELTTAKDTNGQYLTQIDRNLVARELYSIAEPDGISWFWAPSETREKYIRMQNAGIRP